MVNETTCNESGEFAVASVHFYGDYNDDDYNDNDVKLAFYKRKYYVS